MTLSAYEGASGGAVRSEGSSAPPRVVAVAAVATIFTHHHCCTPRLQGGVWRGRRPRSCPAPAQPLYVAATTTAAAIIPLCPPYKSFLRSSRPSSPLHYANNEHMGRRQPAGLPASKCTPTQ